MNGISETIFSFLLGWIKRIFESAWNIFSKPGNISWLYWLEKNWLMIVIMIVAAGFILDIIIWLFRWRPYYVWGTLWRKIKKPFKKKKIRPNTGKSLNDDLPYGERESGEEQFFYSSQQQEYEHSHYFEETAAEPYRENSRENAIEIEPVAHDTQIIYQNDENEKYVRSPEYMNQYARPTSANTEESGEIFSRGFNSENTVTFKKASDSMNLEKPVPYEKKNTSQESFLLTEELSLKEDVQGSIDFNQDTMELNQQTFFQNNYYDDSEKLLSDTAPYKKRKRRAVQHQGSFHNLTKGITSIAKKASEMLNTQEDSHFIDGLPPPIDKKEAFHQPVLPNEKNITHSEDDESSL